MATDFGQLLNNRFGGLIGLPKMLSIDAILRHVQNRLPQFARENRGGAIENETGLTQVLVKLLMAQQRLPYYFHPEYTEDETKGNGPRSDFSVITNQPVKFHARTYADRQRIFTFEAKRLANLGKSREKEYLVGRYTAGKFENNGGVERFKNSTHGNDLSQVGIVGYVQLHDFAHWQNQLNYWIGDLIRNSPTKGDSPDPDGVIWDEGDMLKIAIPATPDWTVYRSQNARGTEQMTIHHIWVNLIP